MENRYEIRGEVTVIFIESQKYGTIETEISTSKLEKAAEIPGKWYANFNKLAQAFYVQGNIVTGKETVKLHRLVSGAPKGMFVDHINHNTLDNKDDNLRIATPAENSQNRNGPQKNNKSGVLGVYWDKSKRLWRARMKKNGKQYHLGYFKKLEDAEKAVVLARSEHMPFSKDARDRTGA